MADIFTNMSKKKKRVGASVMNKAKKVEESWTPEINDLFEALVVNVDGIKGNTYWITINGKSYGYEVTPGFAGGLRELARKFEKIMSFNKVGYGKGQTAGRALAWLKKNTLPGPKGSKGN